MNAELLVPLLALALVDSTSFGTLVIPLWLLIAPGRIRVSRILVYLGTVATCYFGLGLALAAGADRIASSAADVAASAPGRVVQFATGLALIALGLTVEPLTKAGKLRRAEARAQRERMHGPGRLTRWRTRTVTGEGSIRSTVSLAGAATAIEAATMVPYLAAIGLLATSTLDRAQITAVLAGYCMIMILPALLLLGTRIAFHHRVDGALRRLEAFLTRNSREALAWILFIAGVFVLGGALGR